MAVAPGEQRTCHRFRGAELSGISGSGASGTIVAVADPSGVTMTERHTVQHCRWAEATLLLDDPLWTEAETYPWSCRADGDPQTVQDVELCATCGRWVPREASGPDGLRCPDFRR